MTQLRPLDTRVTVLDVGQGQPYWCGRANAHCSDTGGGDPDGANLATTTILPYLRLHGIAELDTLVISHPDLDHRAGAPAILRALRVNRLRYGGEDLWSGKGRPCNAGESWRWPGGQVFRILSPEPQAQDDSNDSSCVLQVLIGEYRLLLPGDIEANRERTLAQYWGDQLRSDWLLASHHGSRTSSSQTFLKRVAPQWVVISSGYANQFGHPHPGVVQRLQAHNIHILSTALDGALEFELQPGQSMRVKPYRRRAQRYWM
ncbi:MAG: ComEC/Rec2 family competence protein [Halioglobus sp.]